MRGSSWSSYGAHRGLAGLCVNLLVFGQVGQHLLLHLIGLQQIDGDPAKGFDVGALLQLQFHLAVLEGVLEHFSRDWG